jgi:drug/metabolite transporter (DMT)-like permease
MKTTRKAFFLILLSSLCAGAGQLVWKKAAMAGDIGNLLSFINYFFFLGILIYFTAVFLMVEAFREGELSVLHPFLSTSYLWVLLVSPLLISGESISATTIIGAVSVFIGVSLIGIGGKKDGN